MFTKECDTGIEGRGILQTYIARIEYDPDTNKARVGFYRGPFFDGPVPPGGGGSGKPKNSGVSTLEHFPK